MPRPVEALPCGSRSMIRTRSPIAASAVPRLIAVVVLPTPPFWLATASTLGGGAASARGANGTTCDSDSSTTGAGVSATTRLLALTHLLTERGATRRTMTIRPCELVLLGTCDASMFQDLKDSVN